MKVNLIIDSSVSKELFTDVFDILNSVPGPIEFNCDYQSTIDFTRDEIYETNLKFNKSLYRKKSLKEDNRRRPKIIDAILSAQQLLGIRPKNESKNIVENTFIEIELECPHCNQNLPFEIYERKEKLKGRCNRCNNSVDIKTYLKFKSNITWEIFLEEYQKEKNKNVSDFNTAPRRITNWEIIFDKCNNYRKIKNIEDEDFVLLLTDIDNSYNWFATLDEKNPFNGFVHSKDWSYFIDCRSAYPIAYEIISLVMKKHIFTNFDDFQIHRHNIPIGCINDFCKNKSEIILKLRTGDICTKCMEKLKQSLPLSNIIHSLKILDSLRKKMLFSQNFMQLTPLSKLVIDKNKNIHLPDFENIQIKLTPLEKTLYMLYLFHPEGIEISFLCDYKTEMYHIYTHISKRGDINEMKSSIDDLVNITTGSASQKISKIKTKFENAIGSELAKNYYIKGENSEVRKIDIDRKLVEVAD